MSEPGKPAAAGATTSVTDEIYTPPDQSLFDFATKHEDRVTERHRREKEQVAHQQRVVMLVVGAVLALAVGGGLIAIIASTLQK